LFFVYVFGLVWGFLVVQYTVVYISPFH
jgi:hypothetical protein